jgi:PAS domain S-box-containing protein
MTENEPRLPPGEAAAEEKVRHHIESMVADRTAELARANERLEQEIAQRRQAEEDLRQANRLLTVLSECNQAIVRATDEPALLQQICRVIVDLGGYPLAWVAFAEPGEAQVVRPVAQAGAEVTWAGAEGSRGPAGRAIRTGRPFIIGQIGADPDAASWQEEARRRGYTSVIALPLRREERVFGALSIYATATSTFGAEEASLWAELAGDLAYGIASLRAREARKRTEEALRESEQRYRGLVEMSPDAVVVHDGRHLLFTNPAAARIMGMADPAKAVGIAVVDFVHPDFRAVVAGRMHDMLQEWKVAPLIEEKFQRADGSPIDVEVAAMPIMWQGAPAVQVTFREITERKQAERVRTALYRLSEAAGSVLSLDELYQDIHTIIGRLMPARNFYIALYDAASETIQFPYYADEFDTTPPPQKLGRGLTDFVLRTGKPLLATPELYAQLVESGQVEKLGSPSVDWLGAPLKTRQGETVGVMAVQTYTEEVRLAATHQDILEFVSTQVAMAIERKRTDEALQQSEEKYRVLIENLSEVIFSLDLSGQFTFISPAIEQYTGYSPEQVIGQPFSRFVHPDDLPGLAASFERSLADQREPYEFRVHSKDGTIRYVRTSSQTLVEEGRVVGLTGVMSDVTRRKRAEEEREKLQAQLLQSQKMEVLGRLAGGVAHDFNNMLAVILGHAEMALQSTVPADPLHAELQEIRSAARRSANLTRQLLAFARKQNTAPIILNLNNAVFALVSMLRRLIGEEIELAWWPTVELWPVRMDPSQIDQVLTNLCVNARDAIDGSGRLTIETANASLDEKFCTHHPGIVPGDYVLLAVSDDGCGMDGETLAHLFEPFFTTKERGKGTGLGLATVYGIVKQNEGCIDVESEPGMGTVFRIYLPRYVETRDQRLAIGE